MHTLVDRTKPAEKRRRACKPKVRTGCITCKKRRVKCDEAKPSCRRCEAAGWECDGYAIPVREWAPPVSAAVQKRSPTPVRASGLSADLAKFGAKPATFIITTSDWPPIQRVIPVDPAATESERRAFHAFQLATEAGMVMHTCDISSFWSQLAPQLGRHYGAVQHALLALGSAYQLYKRTGGAAGGPNRRLLTPADTSEEIFMIKEYNKAIAKLRRYTSEPTPESVAVALVCCLVFICVENLRFNHRGAVAHLTNGIHIIETSVGDEILDGPSSSTPSSSRSSSADSSPSASGASSYEVALTPPAGQQQPRPVNGNPAQGVLSDADLQFICLYFRNAELTMHLFTRSINPVLAYRLYNSSRSRPPADIDEDELACLEDVHRARTRLENDVLARDWEVQPRRADRAFWRRPEVVYEQKTLRDRGCVISERVLQFARGPRAPKCGTPEYASLCLDMLHVRSMQCLIEMQRYRGHGGDGEDDSSDEDEDADADADSDESPVSPTKPSEDRKTSAKKAAYWLTSYEEDLMREMVLFGEEYVRARQACAASSSSSSSSRIGGGKAAPTSEIAVDMGVVAPMYFSYVYTSNAETQERALRVLQNTHEREGPWDTKTMMSIMLSVRNLRSSEAFKPVEKPSTTTTASGDNKVQSPWGSLLEHYEILSEVVEQQQEVSATGGGGGAEDFATKIEVS